jgi:hypothetical protein
LLRWLYRHLQAGYEPLICVDLLGRMMFDRASVPLDGFLASILRLGGRSTGLAALAHQKHKVAVVLVFIPGEQNSQICFSSREVAPVDLHLQLLSSHIRAPGMPFQNTGVDLKGLVLPLGRRIRLQQGIRILNLDLHIIREDHQMFPVQRLGRREIAFLHRGVGL